MGDNESSKAPWTPIECPECESHRFSITQDQPPKAKCADCSSVYPIPTIEATNPPAKERQSAPGSKTRRPNGPAQLAVKPVASPDPRTLGAGHYYTEVVLSGGPDALIAATHEASKLSKKFGEEIEAEWCLSTKWLQGLMVRQRARARYALMWRPRLLAVVAMTRSVMMGCRAAKVAYNTVKAHRRDDPDFDRQVIAAEKHAIELLHDVTMKEAIEGRCEPVFWQGIPIGHIIKTDNRLRIEMLRAHMPDTFKTPGAKVSVHTGDTNNVLVVDEATRNALVELRQEALRLMAGARVSEVESSASPLLPAS
jgi:hypothetical protein